MTKITSKQQQAKILRIFRKVHRTTGALLFIFFFFISVSGILLGWKNNSLGVLLPKTLEGTSTNLKNWLPIDSLHKNACKILHDSVSSDLSLELNRIDIRKNKGVVKFLFENHYSEIQLDGTTGELLQISERQSDFIENLHDGSILDKYFKTTQSQFKLIYTTIMGFALLLFTITGFWLWYGPKKMKQKKRRQN
ncbi:PepSY domain-containing protein [uncultured Lutibacter sp.]|uniref:PepSY domain-containing protein n=1 Tax=uncultured Lutibacter sp. TaxID=437739 RepID=UPI002613A9D1|nr:PepSY domain-containing protein [uncultured Lutibacter sp.]